MKKSHPFNKLSNLTCSFVLFGRRACHKKIKQRLVDQKPTITLCFKHYKMLRKMGISDRKIKKGAY